MYAARNGVICVAAVGNNSQNALVYPAAFGKVIGVASVNSQNQLSSFSNYGPDMVTISAPGGALITNYPGNPYAATWGTSKQNWREGLAADWQISRIGSRSYERSATKFL